MFGRIVQRSMPAARVRPMSSGAASALDIDWENIRAQMPSEDLRQEVDSKARQFATRLAAAKATPAVANLDWDYYKEALPDFDVDAMRADFEAFIRGVPSIEYDESADAKAHSESEAKLDSLVSFAKRRAGELEAQAAEHEDHKMHDFYSLSRVYDRFDGLLEEQDKVWGEMDFVQASYTTSEMGGRQVTPEEELELMTGMSERMGLSFAQMGIEDDVKRVQQRIAADAAAEQARIEAEAAAAHHH